MTDASANVFGAISDLETGMEFDFSETLTPTVAVAEAIAETTDADPTSGPPIYEYVDTDALDALLTESNGEIDSITVSFAYEGHTVVVNGSGQVVVEPADE